MKILLDIEDDENSEKFEQKGRDFSKSQIDPIHSHPTQIFQVFQLQFTSKMCLCAWSSERGKDGQDEKGCHLFSLGLLLSLSPCVDVPS